LVALQQEIFPSQDGFDILLEKRLSGVAEQGYTMFYGKSQIRSNRKDRMMNAYHRKTNVKVIMAVMTMVGVTVCNTVANEISGKVKQGIERDRYLLLDSRVVDSAQNAKLIVGTVQKDKNNPLFAEDKPWESRFDNLYANVIYDEQDKLYKCWYNPFIVDRSSKGMSLEERERKSYRPPGNREMGVCYATSKDGIVWEKPELGIVEFDGSKRNNIVFRFLL
jgi:hypothetical protein